MAVAQTPIAWNEQDAERLIASLSGEPGALLPILHAINERFGHVPDAVVPTIAKALNLSRADVHGTLTFYHDFKRQPPAPHSIKLCRAEACQARGGRALQEHAERRLGVGMGASSAEGIALEPVYCLGNCANGPSALVDGTLQAELDPVRLDALIAGLRNKTSEPPGITASPGGVKVFVPGEATAKALGADAVARAIGEVVSACADFGFATAGLPPTHRALDPALAGGGLLDVGIYPLSFAAFVLGPVEAVQASAEIGPTGVDVHTVFNLRHAGGRLAQGLCSLRATTACLATVLGTAGRIDVTPPFYAAQQLRVVRGAGPSELAPVEVIDRPWRGSPYVAQVEEVHRCLRAGLAESPVMPLYESVALVGWMDAMRAQVGLRYPMD